MLERLSIGGVATYTGPVQSMDGLRQVNFIFGANGSGKTTISRLIAAPADYPASAVYWRRGEPLETLVYNSDYADRTYLPQMPGIFTLGSTDAEVLRRVEEARTRVAGLIRDKVQLRNTLQGDDGASGKRGELAVLRGQFENDCWAIKTEHDGTFQGAFTGVRNSRAKFCDRVISEEQDRSCELVDLALLRERAATVFADGVGRLTRLPDLAAESLVALKQAGILTKRVVGREDVDLGALIRRLGNSDWVRHGLMFVGKAGDPCPMCQKPMEVALLEDLRSFFDEAYAADIDEIDQVQERHAAFAADLLRTANAVLDSGSPHLDPERVRPMVGQLKSLTDLNQRHIERKRAQPSTQVALEDIVEAVALLQVEIDNANAAIDRHNALVDNLVEERAQLTRQIWRRLVEDNKIPIDRFTGSARGLARAVEGLTANIQAKEVAIAEAKAELASLERGVTSVQPTVDEINATLESFGFTSFRLRTAGDEEQLYELVRHNGASAQRSLSEGERSFVTFLYFYHSIRGSASPSGMNVDRVIVLDDPVSSLDSDVLFIVSALIKRLFDEVESGSGRVKQVFVLSHNVYFHKDVSFDTRRNDVALNRETFWIVRKSDGHSIIERHQSNPIRTSYELLWGELRQQGRSSLTIQNTMRRILEHYFKILGNRNKNKIIAGFSGRDQQICSSLFSWINEGSHAFADDLYVTVDGETVDRFMKVFERIFRENGHAGHFDMMMHGRTLATETIAGEAATLVAEELASLGIEPAVVSHVADAAQEA